MAPVRRDLPKRETQSRGNRGATGARGPQGKQGAPGIEGAQGPQGLQGPSMSRTDVLAIVADQFDDIRHRLDVQLTRTGQLQEQLDHQHKETVALQEQLSQVQALLKDLMKVPITP